MQKTLLLAKRLSIALLVAILCRVLFYVFNAVHFTDVSLGVFLYGMRFDLSVIAILFSPFIVLSVLPGIPIEKKGWRKLLWVLFHLPNAICIVLNGIDFGYFEFTLKRSTADLYVLAGQGNDFVTLLPTFLADYWYVVLCTAGLVVLSLILYPKTNLKQVHLKNKWLLQSAFFVLTVGMVLLAARGGLQTRPINIVQAGEYTGAANIPLVLNTPFSIMQTLGKEAIEPIEYFTEDELANIYSPIVSLKSEAKFANKNVVIIIMESLSKEYIGTYNNNEGYTPFLDSLMQHSLVFTNCYANARKSVEAIPAIFSGIPALMDAPYIFSPYSTNRINSIASILKKRGYTSSFFHGGANGTMGFDSYTKIAGFDNYYGRAEYNNDQDYDGNWGIFDEPFFQYTAQALNETQPPFIAGLMSLSTHHPFTIPEQHKNKFKAGKHLVHPTVSYADFALKQFFKTAKKMKWYRNTLFVITADHTFYNFEKKYKTSTGIYAIPLVFFSPTIKNPGFDSTTTQQTDIFPTTLGLVGAKEDFVCFGENQLTTDNGYAVNYLNNIYQLIKNGYVLQFNGEESIGLYNLSNDSLQKQNLISTEKAKSQELEKFLKGIIQSYNYRMVNNKLVLDE